MTQDQLDNIGFALVVARTSMQQMFAIATAFEQHEAARQFRVQEVRFAEIQTNIATGVIKPDAMQ